MVAVKLKQQVTQADLDKLQSIHRELTRLMTGLHPAAPAAVALSALLWATRACVSEWCGDEGWLFKERVGTSGLAGPESLGPSPSQEALLSSRPTRSGEPG